MIWVSLLGSTKTQLFWTHFPQHLLGSVWYSYPCKRRDSQKESKQKWRTWSMPNYFQHQVCLLTLIFLFVYIVACKTNDQDIEWTNPWTISVTMVEFSSLNSMCGFWVLRRTYRITFCVTDDRRARDDVELGDGIHSGAAIALLTGPRYKRCLWCCSQLFPC